MLLHYNKNKVSRLKEIIVPFDLKLLNSCENFLPKARDRIFRKTDNPENIKMEENGVVGMSKARMRSTSLNWKFLTQKPERKILAFLKYQESYRGKLKGLYIVYVILLWRTRTYVESLQN